MRALRHPLGLRTGRDARDDGQRPRHRPHRRLDAPVVTLVCALAVEERAARKAGLPVARVGLGARGALPEGPLISFGLAGSLVPGHEPGTLVVAHRVVDEHGETLWEGEPLALLGARRVVVCAVDRVVDPPDERAALAEASGAEVVDLESGRLAASGRLQAVVRAISDTPSRPAGRLAGAATQAGDTDWLAVAGPFARSPRQAFRTALAGRSALAALERAAGDLSDALDRQEAL